ncbi:uncharacterized protein LOC122386102 isoform X2 [Amphibalanus amphitrite]|uniref:uncharacterized protein LOC122386102 isoform X2 n=1 Tax=Amphibalanus amphitrite TaxID=1232801 RepID=UPI001C8FD39C|nr:uncharacterized protein LOC122386102 isoform X2 [Amphibalanus amphitrite]XP_043230903.1 uncharacterized protein LOC122386102 isoform X2 [Amphibalanus amphitrite]XP_043230904.1 uncharacterized protein LOC122386102 isoform X2 [Amphibalanus amphitrite]XP_043230910.1 uncharacterized protein LOC122386102 isoform X2 [Amphibalanus amphitrite]
MSGGGAMPSGGGAAGDAPQLDRVVADLEVAARQLDAALDEVAQLKARAASVALQLTAQFDPELTVRLERLEAERSRAEAAVGQPAAGQ